MIAMALQFFGAASGISSPRGRLRQQHLCAVAAQLADDPQPRGAARFWSIQRLPAVSAGLCLCGRSGEHRPSAPRISHHGVVRTGNLPCDADDRRPRAGSRADVAAAWCVAGRQLYPAAWHYHSRPWHPALRRAHRTWLAGRPSGVTAPGDMICSHCLLPTGLRAMQRTVNGEDCAFCCYGCCIAFQVRARQERGVGSRLAPDPAWRRRLSLHEHHAVQPPVVYRHLHRTAMRG